MQHDRPGADFRVIGNGDWAKDADVGADIDTVTQLRAVSTIGGTPLADTQGNPL